MKLTPETKLALEKAIAIGAIPGQLFRSWWWSMFCHRKRDKLIQGIIDGKSWRFAYLDAKEFK